MIKYNSRSIELNLIHPIYKTKLIHKKGEEYPEEKIILVKEIRIKKTFEHGSIVSTEEHLNSKNHKCNKRCRVYDKYTGRFYVVAHSKEEIDSVIYPDSYNRPLGYQTKTHAKIHRKRS